MHIKANRMDSARLASGKKSHHKLRTMPKVKEQGRHATNDASIMCSNGGVGCGVGCGAFDSGSGGIDDIVAKGL